MRTQNIAVVTIGYTKLAFEDRALAMQLMTILGEAVQVTDSCWDLNKHDQPHTHFLSDADQLPELKFVPAHNFNTSETVKEAKARLDRELKDREDLEQGMNRSKEPAALAYQAPEASNAPVEEPNPPSGPVEDPASESYDPF